MILQPHAKGVLARRPRSRHAGCLCNQPLMQSVLRRLELDLARRAILGGASAVTEAYAPSGGSSRGQSIGDATPRSSC